MNHRSMKIMKGFLGKYRKEGMSILDVGSWKKRYQKCFREIIPEGYTGIDIRPGSNVDLVVEPYDWPFEDGSFDLVISGACFEHTERFWDVFKEMVRILKPNGMMCVIAPFGYSVHKFPIDCWRFLPDGMAVLAKTYNVELIKSYIARLDCVGIFHKC